MNEQEKAFVQSYSGCCSYRQLFRVAGESAPAAGGWTSCSIYMALQPTVNISPTVLGATWCDELCCSVTCCCCTAHLPQPCCFSSKSSKPSLPTLISRDFQKRTQKHHRVILGGASTLLGHSSVSYLNGCVLPRGLCTNMPRVPTQFLNVPLLLDLRLPKGTKVVIMGGEEPPP